MSLKRSKTMQVNDWLTWWNCCAESGVDPQECGFSVDIGGGDTLDYEYTGEYPEVEKGEK